MPPKRKKSRNLSPKRPVSWAEPPRYRRKYRRRKSRKPRLGEHLAKVSRTVLAALPGSAFTIPIADFVFNLFGVTSTIVDLQGNPSKNMTIVANAVGMYGAVSIVPRMFMASDPAIGLIEPPYTTKDKTTSNNNPMVCTVWTQFTEAQCESFWVRAKCSGPRGDVDGYWAIGFVPFLDKQSQEKFENLLVTVSSFEYISVLPYCTKGCVNEDLYLRVKLRPRHGRAYQPMALDCKIGMLIIAYEDVMRSSAANFTTSDFQTTIETGAIIRYMTRDPTGGWSLNTEAVDPLNTVGGVIRSSTGNYAYMKQGSVYKYEKGQVSITSTFSRMRDSTGLRPYPAGGVTALDFLQLCDDLDRMSF